MTKKGRRVPTKIILAAVVGAAFAVLAPLTAQAQGQVGTTFAQQSGGGLPQTRPEDYKPDLTQLRTPPGPPPVDDSRAAGTGAGDPGGAAPPSASVDMPPIDPVQPATLSPIATPARRGLYVPAWAAILMVLLGALVVAVLMRRKPS